MNDHSIAEGDVVIKHNIRVDTHALAKLTVTSNKSASPNPRARTDRYSLTNHHIRFDGHIIGKRRRRSDTGGWVSGYLRELYQMPGIAETVVMQHIKAHYYASHRNLNPTGIVPKGPILDFLAPHGRQR